MIPPSSPGTGLAYTLLGLAARQQGAAAAAILRQVYALRDLGEGELADAADCALGHGMLFAARAFVRRWVVEYPESAEACRAVARLLFVDEATRIPVWMGRAARLGLLTPDVLPWGGRDALHRGDVGAADSLFRVLAILDPGSPDAYAGMAAALSAAGRSSALVAAMVRRAVMLEPEDGAALVRAGLCLVDAARPKPALPLFAAVSRLPRPPTRLTGRPDIVAKLLDGQSLTVVMTPDPRSVANWPEYRENYQFDVVYASGDHFWAYPQVFDGDPEGGELMTFCYSSDPNFFGRFMYGGTIYSDEPGTFIASPRDAYRDFTFITRQDFAVVFDSDAGTDTDALAAAIQRGAQIRCAVQTETDVWMMMPVNLAFWYPHDGSFKLTTELRVHAALTDLPAEALAPVWARFIDAYAARTEWVLPTMQVPSPRVWSRLSISSEGTYTRYVGEGRIREGVWRRLRLFARPG